MLKKILVSVVMLSVSSNVFWAQGGGGTNGQIMKCVVPVEVVTERENEENNSYVGIVLPLQVVKIVSIISGELLEVGFKDGSRVIKGQMLYRMDNIKYLAAVKKAEAQVEQCKATVNYAQKSFDRDSTLLGKGMLSQDAWDNSQSTLLTNQASQSIAEADLISAREDLRNCTIIAPIDGIVATTNYTVGNYLTPSSGTLVTIIQVNPVRVRFAISNRDYLNLFGSLDNFKSESGIAIVLADGSPYSGEGTIELMNMEANRNTDTVQIFALFDNPQQQLIPNSTVTVNLTRKNAKKLPAVPASAILHDSRGAYVWLLDDKNMVKKQNVILGNTDGSTQMILSGLKAGDSIVTDGTHKVMVGMEVEPDRKVR